MYVYLEVAIMHILRFLKNDLYMYGFFFEKIEEVALSKAANKIVKNFSSKKGELCWV